MRSTFKVWFYVKKSAVKSNGKAPVMARITVNNQAVQCSLKCEVNPSDWDVRFEKVCGRSASSKQLNALLDSLRATIIEHYRKISERDATVTAEKVRNAFLGISSADKTLLLLFDEHLDTMKAQLGKKGFTLDNLQKYSRTRERLADFMKLKYKLSDISLKEINYSFICDFEAYIKTAHHCSQNTATKFVQRLRTIILIARNNGWITIDPFTRYKFHTEKKERGYLTDDELQRLMGKDFGVQRLEKIRDIFVFSCFSGLAYVDIVNLKAKNIQKAFDGNLWIIGERMKTGVRYRVPFLDIPKQIIEKYKGESCPGGTLLPVVSNQKTNAYLKEIADVCGISKRLTFHIARHTFATLTLSKGVSIESVSKMLGHTDIKTTQIYAKITDHKISDEMKRFAGKLQSADGFPSLHLSNVSAC